MNKEQMAFFATARLTGDQLRGLTRDQLRWLTGDQLRGLTRDQLSWLTGDQLSWLTGDQLRWLTRDQLRWLTRDQLRGLTRDQLRGLTDDQLRWLTGDQLRWLTDDQLSWLTGDQLRWLTRDRNALKVDNLYSKILDGIKKSERKLDQKKFGPVCDPQTNLCNTPMCIAGHTVNLAGEAGYKLAQHIGHAGAARIIHAESRPDAPEPRYDIYPNEWALAYIEMRAAEESK